MMKTLLMAGASALVLSSVCGAASAATILVGATFEKEGNGQNWEPTFPDSILIDDANDCSGYFGKANDDPEVWCDVGAGLDEAVSPWVAKLDGEDSNEDTTNEFFSSIDGDEFSFEFDGGDGSWLYNPGAGDPAIRYWVAKAGDFFNLFWTVDAESENCKEGLFSSNYTLACLEEALSVTAGSFTSPKDSLSHITFYDTGETPPPPIPLPAAGWLLLAGVGGLAAMRRKKTA
jgi:hypothetical protein